MDTKKIFFCSFFNIFSIRKQSIMSEETKTKLQKQRRRRQNPFVLASKKRKRASTKVSKRTNRPKSWSDLAEGPNDKNRQIQDSEDKPKRASDLTDKQLDSIILTISCINWYEKLDQNTKELRQSIGLTPTERIPHLNDEDERKVLLAGAQDVHPDTDFNEELKVFKDAPVVSKRHEIFCSEEALEYHRQLYNLYDHDGEKSSGGGPTSYDGSKFKWMLLPDILQQWFNSELVDHGTCRHRSLTYHRVSDTLMVISSLFNVNPLAVELRLVDV